jgi:nicotinic acid mononucleotide adenylyltransferase
VVRVGCYPGSFNPPTSAHVAVADAARATHGLDRVDLVVSRVPLAKGPVARPRFEDRMAVLGSLADRLGWLAVVVSDGQLIADLAQGYGVVIMGADKWAQIHELRFYDGSADRRDAALARLPTVALAPRDAEELIDHDPLAVDQAHRSTSSTAARDGARHLMVPEARDFDELTGAWTDPARYDAWLRAAE